jgi:hypothetical protein
MVRLRRLDRWVATGTTTRLVADRFLPWEIKSRLAASDLTLPKHRRGTSRRFCVARQDQAIQQVVQTDELTPRDRAAAILLLVFALQIEKVVQLTWVDVTITDALVTVRLAGLEIALPEPLAGPWRQLAASPGHDQTAAHPNSNWVFLRYSPGQHINAMSLRERLRSLFGPLAARLGALEELSKLAPVAIAIIAETLGYYSSTIERHAVASSAGYAEYIAAVSQAAEGPLESN